MPTYTIPKNRDTEVRVTRSTFQGRERLDVREYWRPEEGQKHVATKRGVNVRLEDLPRVLDALRKVEADAIRSGDLVAEDYTSAGLDLPAALTDEGFVINRRGAA